MLLNALSVIIGLSGTIALSNTLSFELEKTAYTNSTVSFLFTLMAAIILRYLYLHLDFSDKRGAILAGVYVAAISFALTTGKQLHTVENFDVGNLLLWLQMILIALFFHGPVWYWLQWFAKKKNAKINGKEFYEEGSAVKDADKKQNAKAFLLTWLVIFICWIPVFLAFYPGAFVYDAQDEYVQVVSRAFTTHHPLTHVLLLGGCVCFGNKFMGSYNAGIAIYTIFQMIVLSGIFAYSVSFLRRKLSKGICIAMTLVYGLFPIFPMYAVCSSKDTLFTGTFLLLLVQLVRFSEVMFITDNAGVKELCKQNKGSIAALLLSMIVMMLLRNNGVYVIIAMLLLTLLVAVFSACKRGRILVFSVLFATGLLLYKGIDITLAAVLQADDSENQEILTVPIQQLARTYKYSPEIFSKEEKEVLFSYIPEDILQIYDADLSDLLKAHFNNQQYSKTSSDFWKLWMNKLAKKPVTYLNAWFMTSYGYWYPDTVINVYGGQQRFTFQYGDSSYFGFETEQPGVRDSKFPWLEEQYRKMSLEIYQQNVPVISMLFSPGFLFWMFMGSILCCIYKREYTWLLPFGCIFLLWGTAILGPTFLVRYVLALWFALPLWSVLYYNDCEKELVTDKEA